MDWHNELRTLVIWWAGWTVLDAVWKSLLGGTILSYIGLLIARYRQSPLQRELRGAAVGFAIATIVIMASLLIARPVITPESTSPSHLGCKPITTNCPKDSVVEILAAGSQTSVAVFNTGDHSILVGGPNISPSTGEGALISPHTPITIDSSAAIYCYGVDGASTVSIECTSP